MVFYQSPPFLPRAPLFKSRASHAAYFSPQNITISLLHTPLSTLTHMNSPSRDAVQDYSLEFRKARGNLSKTREHHDLLSRLLISSCVRRRVPSNDVRCSVRRDIRTYKTGMAGAGGAGSSGGMTGAPAQLVMFSFQHHRVVTSRYREQPPFRRYSARAGGSALSREERRHRDRTSAGVDGVAEGQPLHPDLHRCEGACPCRQVPSG